MTKGNIGKWYFGWNIVAVAALLTMLTVGMRMGIGPFFLPIKNDLGFSRSWLSTVIAIGMLCYGIGMPIAGYLVSICGTRLVLLLGATIVFLSSIWTALSTGPINFLLAFGIALSLGLAFTSPVAITPLISRWFTRQRGMALFFLATGSMAGIAVMTPVFTYSIDWFGWRETMVGFAVIFVIITVPTALIIIREDAPANTDLLPEQVITKPASTTTIDFNLKMADALRTMPFWQICLGLFACGFSMNLLGTHGVPMLIDHGFDDKTSSFGIGLIGLVAIFSTLVLGRLSDILERRSILAVIYFVRGLGFFALVIAATPWQLFTFAAIGGIVWSGSIAMSSAILADIYGIRLVGMLYGWAYLGHQIGAMISSWIGGWAYEVFHTHWISFGAAGVLLLIAAVISLYLPKRGTKLVIVPMTTNNKE